MKAKSMTKQELLMEVGELRQRLEEAEETLRAIRSGEVDGLVVSTPQGEQVFTLAGADYPYRVLIEEMNEGAFTMVIDGTILYCNSRFAEIIKKPLEKVINSSFFQFIAPENKAVVDTMIQGERGNKETSEIELRAEDGSMIPVYFSINFIEMEHMRAICAVVTDLTEQKRNEEILKAAKLANSILEQSTEVIIICDENGRIIKTSQEAHHHFSPKLLRQHFDSVVPLSIASLSPLQPKQFSISSVLSGNIIRSLEVTHRRDDTKESHFLLSSRPLTHNEKGVLGCVVSLTDITERKQMEEELRKSRDELETKVQERTAELARTNEELRAEITERKRTEEALQKLTYSLNERVKEINCLYSISYYVDKQYLLLEEKLKNIVNLIPSGWQFPETTCARIVLEGKEYRTDNFRETPWKQSSDIIVHDGKTGTIEVGYLENKPEAYEGPFLKEERGLINTMAIEIGEMFAQMQAERRVRVERQRLYDVLETLPTMISLLTPDYHVAFANRSFRNRFGESGGRHCYEYCFGRTGPCDFCEAYKVLETGKPHQWEVTAPDSISVIDAYDFPFTDTDGSALILEMGIDITERKKAEDALRQSEARLRHLSSELLLVQENERKRIAREIHDSIGQTLAAIKFGLENKLDQMGKAPAPPGVSLENIVSLAQNGIEESRRIQMDLRPSILDDLGIVATIGWFVRDFQKIYSGIRIEKETEIDEKEIPDALKIDLYRVLQEAMNNIAKHSKANLVRLTLEKIEDKIELKIEDNGMGFDLENYRKGLGLTSMRERIELSGGSFWIESTPGKGTMIKARWII